MAWNRFAVSSLSLVLGSIALNIILSFHTFYTNDSGQTVNSPTLESGLGPVGSTILNTLLFAAFVVGIVFGHLGLRQDLRHLRGRGLALAGIIIGYSLIALALLIILFVVVIVGLFAASR